MKLGLKTRLAACVAVFAGLAGSARPAKAVEAYTTNFDAYANGPLAGQDMWSAISGVGTNSPQVLGTANKFVSLVTSGEDVSRDFADITEGSGYLGLDVNLSAAQAAGDYFAHFTENASTSNFRGRLFARSSGSGYQLGFSTSSTNTTDVPTYGSIVLNFNETYRVVMRYDIVTGASNDTGAVFVNPVSPVEASNTPYLTSGYTGGVEAANLGAVNFRQGTAANAPAVASLDNLVVATDFASAAVPEPGSLAAALTLGGLLLMRRRRATSP